MKIFKSNTLLPIVPVIVILVITSCTKNRTGQLNEILNFKSDFKFCLIDTTDIAEGIIENNKIDWQLSSRVREIVSDSLLIADSKFLCLRKNFSMKAGTSDNDLLLRMSNNTPFVAFLNGKEIMSYDVNLIRNNNPAYTKASGSIAIFNYRAVQNFFIPGEKVTGLLKETNNELFIVILKRKISTVKIGDISLSADRSKPVKNFFNNKPYYGQDAVFTRSEFPILFIQTNGQIIRDEPKIMALMGIVNNKNHKNRVGDSCRYFYGNIGIELRGHTSQTAAKQSYAIKIYSPQWEKISVSFFNMPADDDWILYGPYSDISLIRDVFVYKLSNAMGNYAVRTQYVELVINDDYRGIYVLMEHPGRGKGKIDIASAPKNNSSGDGLTGGYIFKIDMDNGFSWKSDYPLDDSIAKHQYFVTNYPKNPGDAQQQYVINLFRRFEETLYQRYNSDEIFSLIDVNSFIDYFIINELTRNIDAYRMSTYLYKDRDSIDPKIHIGPVWDFNLSLGTPSYLDGYKPEGWVYNRIWEVPFWWKYLLKNEDFKKKLVSRWHELRKSELSAGNIEILIDEEVNRIENARKRNFIKWPVIGIKLQQNYTIPESYPDEIFYLKTWIRKRIDWLDVNIEKFNNAASQ